MSRMLLILILGTGAIFALVSLNINQSNTAMVVNSVEEYSTAQAKNYASGAIDIALQNLSSDSTWGGVQLKQLDNGSFTINVQNTAASYFQGPSTGLQRGRLITAIGRCGSVSDTIRAVIQLPDASASASAPPPFMKYAIATGNNLSMNGSVLIRDDNNRSWNANVHTNSNFSMNGNNTINGFLSYTGGAQSNPDFRLNTSISPNQNPDNLPVHSSKPTVEIPAVNVEEFRSKATVIYNTNKSVSGNTSLGTKENPQIIFVDGDLNISGNISGYGVFVVKGNINVNGNVTIDAVDAQGSNLGLYTQRDLSANGNVKLKAQIFTGGNANLGGNVKVYGSITAKGTVNFNGNVSIYYRPANAALTNPFWKGEEGEMQVQRAVIISYFD